MVERMDTTANASVAESNAEETPNQPAAEPVRAVRAAPDQPMPMFYKKIELLSPGEHGNLSLKEHVDLSFTAGVDHIPLMANEFVDAQRHYPIVFSGGPEGGAFALVGGLDGVNLFVEPDGSWSEGCYTPAYVRRYPFMVARVAETGQWAMAIDRESPIVAESEERPLYEGEEPSEILKSAIELCRKYAASEDITKAFCRTLHELDLLSEGQVSLDLPGEQTRRYGGFRMIDREKFDALPADVIESWRKNRYLDAIYAHFASIGSWETLRHRIAART